MLEKEYFSAAILRKEPEVQVAQANKLLDITAYGLAKALDVCLDSRRAEEAVHECNGPGGNTSTGGTSARICARTPRRWLK